MAANFRSSFHGFNREDVVHYLDYLNKKHDEVRSQLSSETEALRQKLETMVQSDPVEVASLKERCAQLESALSDTEAEKKALEDQIAALREELGAGADMLKDRCAQLEGALSDAQTEKQSLVEQVSSLREALGAGQETLRQTQEALSRTQEALRQAQADRDAEKARFGAVQSRQELELEAYRRAERAERMARERADQVYRQTNGVLADATAKVEEAATQITDISNHVMSQLDLLRSAVDGSKQALADAAAGLYSLKPKEE